MRLRRNPAQGQGRGCGRRRPRRERREERILARRRGGIRKEGGELEAGTGHLGCGMEPPGAFRGCHGNSWAVPVLKPGTGSPGFLDASHHPPPARLGTRELRPRNIPPGPGHCRLGGGQPGPRRPWFVRRDPDRRIGSPASLVVGVPPRPRPQSPRGGGGHRNRGLVGDVPSSYRRTGLPLIPPSFVLRCRRIPRPRRPRMADPLPPSVLPVGPMDLGRPMGAERMAELPGHRCVPCGHLPVRTPARPFPDGTFHGAHGRDLRGGPSETIPSVPWRGLIRGLPVGPGLGTPGERLDDAVTGAAMVRQRKESVPIRVVPHGRRRFSDPGSGIGNQESEDGPTSGCSPRTIVRPRLPP